jgi:energy-coupling factor transporter ATP-binding protein EcfA2
MLRPDRVQAADVLVLHSSAVVTPGGALLFLGHASAGKSTICRLLAERFPPLADDAVYLTRQEDGAWYVADGTRRAFAGPLEEDELAGLDGVPLRAILRLFQAPTPRLAPLGQLETCRYLTDALFEIGWPKQKVETARGMFAAVAQVARSYPGWQLYFSVDHTTSGLVFRTFV